MFSPSVVYTCANTNIEAFTLIVLPLSCRDQPAGGHDYDLVDSLSSRYLCPICAKVLRDAHLTVCCGQHFCASCLTHWLGTQQRRKTCPHCRKTNFQHVPNKEKIREVNELKIRCTNHREGCRWVGELGGLKRHLESHKGCSYVEVACTNKGCRERVRRKDLQNHLQEQCHYRCCVCEHCGHRDTYKAMASHYIECPEYPLACPNRCGVTGIRRRAMPDHHSSCPLEPLDCPFKDAGCTEKVARKDMEDHMTANQQKHILQSLQSLRDSNQRIMQQLHKTEQEVQDLRTVAVGLNTVGATLTFRVTDFSRLRKGKLVWCSLPFSIAGKVRVHLSVYPSGIGIGQGSHVSLSLILLEVLEKDRNFWLAYDVSVSAMQQQTPYTTKILELCTFRRMLSDSDWSEDEIEPRCFYEMQFPSAYEVLLSEEMFVDIEDISTLLVDDSMRVNLNLLQHDHCWASI